MVQSVELPGISLGIAPMSTSVHDFPVPGETLTYDDLTCTFVVDEKMSNYSAIYDWMFGMGFPRNHEQYSALMRNSKNSASLSELAKGYTDGILHVLGNDQLPIIQAHFVDCFPTRLSGLQFSSNNSDSEPIIANVTFAYSYFTLTVA